MAGIVPKTNPDMVTRAMADKARFVMEVVTAIAALVEDSRVLYEN
ncbi:hypothetical protein [Nostoc sp.]